MTDFPARSTADWLVLYVVYRDPRDFPGRYVVRRQAVRGGTIRVEPAPLAVVDTLAAARAAIPPGLAWLDRQPGDEPQVVEVWL